MKKIIFAFACALFLPAITFAAGISVSPARLDFSIGKEQKSSQLTITVINPTADVQLFDIYPDEFNGIIKISPESFTLESGGRKTVTVTVQKTATAENELISTNISVISKPLAESKLNLATGVKIPLKAQYNLEQKNNSPQTVLIIVGAAVLVFIAYKLGGQARKKQQN